MKNLMKVLYFKHIYCAFLGFQMLIVEIREVSALFFPKLQQIFITKQASKIIPFDFPRLPFGLIATLLNRNTVISVF